MAIGATMHTFEVELADVDRGVYETLSLRLAQHPSETGAYMVTRLLAYLLEYQEGIEFSDGVAATDEPAVLIRDLTGRLLAWIEVGAPEPERLHQGSKAADRCVVYTHREPSRLLARYVGKKIHQADAIAFHSSSTTASSTSWPAASSGATPSPCRAPKASSTPPSTATRLLAASTSTSSAPKGADVAPPAPGPRTDG